MFVYIFIVVILGPYSALTDQPHSTDLSKYDVCKVYLMFTLESFKKMRSFSSIWFEIPRMFSKAYCVCLICLINIARLKDMFEIHKETCSHSNLQNIYDHSNSMTIKSSWRRPPKQDNSLVQL